MTEEKKVKKTAKKSQPRALALKNLCTSEGQVKKGQFFDCTEKELTIFKAAKAV
jgi:hypothetical protein